jgi:hypothetical protein
MFLYFFNISFIKENNNKTPENNINSNAQVNLEFIFMDRSHLVRRTANEIWQLYAFGG